MRVLLIPRQRTLRTAIGAFSLKSVVTSDPLKPNWCLHVSILLFVTACLVPLACAYFEAGTSSQMMDKLLVDKYVAHYGIIGLQLLFATVHSGLASLRSLATKWVGERIYRIGFAVSSLPLAVLMIEYFVSYRYDGVIFWQIRNFPGIHELVWFLSFVSFYFLYPGTFRLLEIAALEKPELHLFKDG